MSHGPATVTARDSGPAGHLSTGPLIEVPVLVGLVYVSLALRARFYSTEVPTDVSTHA